MGSILERLSPAHWWADPSEPIDGPVYLALAVVLGLVFVAGAAVWILAPRLSGGHRFHQRLIERYARLIMVLVAVGLLLMLFRWQLVPFFSKRIWFYLWWLAVFAFAAYGGYFYRYQYADRLAAWEGSDRRRRYLPKASHKPGTRGRRSRRRR